MHKTERSVIAGCVALSGLAVAICIYPMGDRSVALLFAVLLGAGTAGSVAAPLFANRGWEGLLLPLSALSV